MLFFDRLARSAPLVLLAVSAALLGGAFAMQHLAGIEPCELCLYQRIPPAIGGVLALTALVLPRWRGPVVGLTGHIFLAGAGLAFYHIGVEQHWWAPPACATIAPARTLEELRAQLATALPPRCDEVRWSLFGLSLAGYNFLASLALAGFGLAAAARLLKGPSR